MKSPLFTIIIPTLNEEKFLPQLLASLEEQLRTDFEVIVVDGSSADQTVSIAEGYTQKLPKLTIITSKKASLPLQRNLGAKQAQGEWLIFVDADSVFLPYFLTRVHDFIEETKPQVFTSWAKPDSDSIHDAIFTLFTNVYYESTLLFKRPLTPGPLTIIRKDIFDRVGGYDVRQKFHEDVEFGLRLAKNGISLTVLRETLYVWSMRRIRHEGKIKVMNQYIFSILPILFFRRPFKSMPGYIMGGQLYDKKRNPLSIKVKAYETGLKRLMKELFN